MAKSRCKQELEQHLCQHSPVVTVSKQLVCAQRLIDFISTRLPFNRKQTIYKQDTRFYSCDLDLDLDSMTSIYELNLDISNNSKTRT